MSYMLKLISHHMYDVFYIYCAFYVNALYKYSNVGTFLDKCCTLKIGS